jgi:hypothetical protein
MGAGASITEASSAEEIAGKVVELGGCWVSAPRTVPSDSLNDRLLFIRVAHIAVTLSRSLRTTLRSPHAIFRSPT